MDNLEYSIGYVSKFTGLPQSVLRYWETVIDVFKPHKTEGGTRRYSDRDIELVLKIKNLLYDQKLTIAGANKQLTNPSQIDENDTLIISKKQFLQLIHELETVIKFLVE